MKIGRVLGIDIKLDWSVLVLVLMVFNSFSSLFAVKLAELSPLAGTLATCFTVVGLLGSILLHELGHAYVGQLYGLTFHSITLHAFGGAAMMSNRIPSARAEFRMAIAGPVVSVLLGMLLGFTSVGLAVVLKDSYPVIALFFFRILSVLAAVNISLGIFNMIPAFPLDGGRVLRSAVWKFTNSYLRATEVAAKSGLIFGGALIGCGALMALGVHVPMFGVGLGNGLWLAIIGFLVIAMAKNEVRHARLNP